MQVLYAPNAPNMGSVYEQTLFLLPGGAPIEFPDPPPGGFMKFNDAANSGLLVLLEDI